MPPSLQLIGVEPTIYFARDGDSLRQLVHAKVANSGPDREGWLRFSLPGQEVSVSLGLLAPGEGTYEVYVPDLREPARVTVALLDGQGVCDEQTLQWRPQRHWEIHVVQVSHHDLGYTDLPSNLLAEHDTFFDDVVRYCRETEDWDEDSRFRYTVEQAWSVLHYLEHRPADQREAVLRLIRDGRIELTGLFGNETSEICGDEEQIRLLYPTQRLARKLGIAVEAAELNDVPGVSWGLASVLAGAGVRYFAPRIPDYFSWSGMNVHPWWDEAKVMPRDAMGAFWWEGPDGKRVLFWFGYRFFIWTAPQAMRDLPDLLGKLENRGYSADVVRFNYQGGYRDNAPPGIHLSYAAREWNQRWAYPRLIVSTDGRFFSDFERRYGKGLRVLRGDVTNTDYTVGAVSTAKETALNRLAHDALLAAEKMAAFAATVSDLAYPADAIAGAYDQTMLYDEHTWGMSACYGSAHEANVNEKGHMAHKALATAYDVLSKSTNRIADDIGLAESGYHVVAFNSLSWPRCEIARGLFHEPETIGRPMYWRPGDGSGRPPMFVSGTATGRDLFHLPAELAERPLSAVDVATGEAVPCQVLRLGSAFRPVPYASYRAGLVDVDPGHEYELLFAAKDVPPCGYRTYRLTPTEDAPFGQSDIRVTGTSIENRYYRVTLDAGSGSVVSIWDKEANRELVDGSAPHKLNQLVVRSARTGAEHPFVFRSLRTGADGPLYGSLIVEGEAEGCPRVAQEVGLYSDVKRVHVANRVLRDSTPLLEFYFAFPFAVSKPRFAFEAPNAVIEPIRDQIPGANTDAFAVGHWVEVAGEDITIGWNSSDAPVADIGALWPGYVSQAHHAATPPGYGHEFLSDPSQYERGHIYSYFMASNFRTNFSPVQVSDVLFRYAITSHAPGEGRLATDAFGWEAANPLTVAYVTGPSRGGLPPSASFAEVDVPNVQVQTLKGAEDGDGLIVRLREKSGQACVATVTLPSYTIAQAVRCNLVEANVGIVTSAAHSFSVPLAANEVVTVRCRGRRYAEPKHLAYY